MNTRFKTPELAYRYMVGMISQSGDRVIDENGYATKEMRNIQITITDPCNPQNWPIPNTGWKLPALDEYVTREILSPNTSMPDGFRYTYGERLFNYPYCSWESSQIAYIIKKLNAEPTSRRAFAITYDPDLDMYEDSIPCLQLVNFLIRDGKLHLTAVFRSWDVKRAGPENLYGLSKLLEYVAEKVVVPTGELTVFAISAHIYED
ncbi:MAG: thymidylate synthase [Bacilli bacterium]